MTCIVEQRDVSVLEIFITFSLLLGPRLYLESEPQDTPIERTLLRRHLAFVELGSSGVSAEW